MGRELRPALVVLALLTALTGVVYPALVTGAARLLFADRAHGSLVYKAGRPAGSELIGQPFLAARYFWSRPSATTPLPYNAAASAGSNLGPRNPALATMVAARVVALRAADANGAAAPVPVDLVTTSASGLDPHISPAAAYFQVRRVARARGVPEPDIRALVARYVEGRQWGVLGEPRVNVLRLNRALDGVR